jgi:phosphoglycolate phosphatase-like HAD superfamily hydrolase
MMKKVIFDVDGVLLSEKRYFDVSALVLWEWYYSKGYMNLEDDDVTTAVSERQIVSLRARLWEQDQILTWLKQHGINNNWDMVHAHILVVLWLLLEQYQADGGAVPAWEFKTYGDIRMAGQLCRPYGVPKSCAVLQRLQATVPDGVSKDDVFVLLGEAMARTLCHQAKEWAKLESPLWQLHFHCFQNWYFGDVLYEQTYHRTPYAGGKQGFLQREEPLGTIEGIRHMFRELKRRGYDIAIGTGRSYMEMKIPFEAFGWYGEFNPQYICTETDVVEAGQKLGLSLGKPNPFVYYAAAFGKDPAYYAQYAIQDGLPDGAICYIVGDSLSDVWCAQKMGARMIGTLTGLEGKAARQMFEREGVTHIVDSVEGILDILD